MIPNWMNQLALNAREKLILLSDTFFHPSSTLGKMSLMYPFWNFATIFFCFPRLFSSLSSRTLMKKSAGLLVSGQMWPMFLKKSNASVFVP